MAKDLMIGLAMNTLNGLIQIMGVLLFLPLGRLMLLQAHKQHRLRKVFLIQAVISEA